MLENEDMPKVLVLFDGADDRAASLAESTAAGARGVRFTEVDIRVMGDQHASAAPHGVLESPETIAQYDGVIITVADRGASRAIETALNAMLAAKATTFVDTVFAVTGLDVGAMLQAVGRFGGIMVAEPRGVGDALDRARQLGGRVAKVAGWVRHALSHE